MFFNFFFWIFGACFEPKILMYLSRRILFHFSKKTLIFLIFKSDKKFSWTDTLEFWAEKMPKKSKKKS